MNHWIYSTPLECLFHEIGIKIMPVVERGILGLPLANCLIKKKLNHFYIKWLNHFLHYKILLLSEALIILNIFDVLYVLKTFEMFLIAIMVGHQFSIVIHDATLRVFVQRTRIASGEYRSIVLNNTRGKTESKTNHSFFFFFLLQFIIYFGVIYQVSFYENYFGLCAEKKAHIKATVFVF